MAEPIPIVVPEGSPGPRIREKETAQAVREVLGVPASRLSDDDAIALACDPSRNVMLGQAPNVSTFDKLTRAMHHGAYTFRKKLSHAADSHDQRHRMTPASRKDAGIKPFCPEGSRCCGEPVWNIALQDYRRVI